MPVADLAALLADETRIGHAPRTGGRLRVGLLFPSEYAVGMANLALQTLCRLFNELTEVSCERLFYPPPQSGTTLTSLETGTPLGGFDLVAISSSYELDWLRIPAALRAGGVEPLATDRGERAPLVLIGGPAVTANPEPLALIADALFIGEAEESLAPIADALLSTDGRTARLERLAELPSMYVPAIPPGAPVPRAMVADLDAWPTHTELLTPHAEFPNTFLVEVGRGCPRGCAFCLARRIYAPVRFREMAGLLETAELGLRFTDRIGLLGAAVGDHPRLTELMTAITERGGAVSTSSLRIETVTPEMLEPLVRSGQRTITLAPEVADDDLARVLGKPIGREALHRAVQLASQAGITGVKLYFMVGVPGETDAQALAIADLVAELEAAFPALRLTVALSPLTPKPHTPLALAEVPGPQVVRGRLGDLRNALKRRTHAQVRLGSARWAAVQTALSRGGRELTPVLLQGAEMGAGEVLRTMSARGLNLDSYLAEQREDGPWAMVDPCPAEEAPDAG